MTTTISDTSTTQATLTPDVGCFVLDRPNKLMTVIWE